MGLRSYSVSEAPPDRQLAGAVEYIRKGQRDLSGLSQIYARRPSGSAVSQTSTSFNYSVASMRTYVDLKSKLAFSVVFVMLQKTLNTYSLSFCYCKTNEIKEYELTSFLAG